MSRLVALLCKFCNASDWHSRAHRETGNLPCWYGLWSHRYTVAALTDKVVITGCKLSASRSQASTMRNLPFVVALPAFARLVVLNRLVKLLANIAVRVWLSAAVPLLRVVCKLALADNGMGEGQIRTLWPSKHSVSPERAYHFSKSLSPHLRSRVSESRCKPYCGRSH